MTNVKFINVPKYDELSVTNLMPKVKDNAEFMAYMPGMRGVQSGAWREWVCWGDRETLTVESELRLAQPRFV